MVKLIFKVLSRYSSHLIFKLFIFYCIKQVFIYHYFHLILGETKSKFHLFFCDTAY